MSEKEYFIRMMSISPQLSTAEQVEHALNSIVTSLGMNIGSYRGKKDKLIPIPGNGVRSVLPRKEYAITDFIIQQQPKLEMSIDWYPPDDDFLMLRPRDRLSAIFHIAWDWGWDFAQQLLLKSVNELNAYWAELNNLAAVTGYTLCSLQGHSREVPRFGSANFFGKQYVEYFGGLPAFERAGFDEVMPVGDGVFVILTRSSNRAIYLSRRQQVEQMFPEDTFAVRSPRLPDYKSWWDEQLGKKWCPDDFTWEIEIKGEAKRGLPQDLGGGESHAPG